MDYSKLKVLYYYSEEIKRNDILWGLIGMGVDVTGSSLVVSINEISPIQVETISKEVKNFDFVITQNFYVNVAEGCHLSGIRYISWIYDSPQIALYTKYALYPENYVFVFDKKQLSRLKAFGIPHIFYQPLAANLDFLSTLKITNYDDKQYSADLSFVGQFYYTNALKELHKKMSDEETFQFNELVNSTYCNWKKGNNIYEYFDTKQLDFLRKYIRFSDFDYYHMEEDYATITLFLSPMIAHLERIRLLSEAGINHDVKIYTHENNMNYVREKTNCHVFPPIDDNILYKVYHASKLTLNVTLKSIETGIPQRVFDIMAVGGVVISNYQAEIDELFVPDKDIVTYESIEEYNDKLDFYAKNDTARRIIASNGRKKVCEEYNYAKSLSLIFAKSIN